MNRLAFSLRHAAAFFALASAVFAQGEIARATIAVREGWKVELVAQSLKTALTTLDGKLAK